MARRTKRLATLASLGASFVVGVVLLLWLLRVLIERGLWADETGSAGYTTSGEVIVMVVGLALVVLPIAWGAIALAKMIRQETGSPTPDR